MGGRLFGDKSIFAIETKPYKIPRKHYLRIWFDNKAIGDYKKGGSLDYAVNSFFKLLENQHSLYENKFDTMSDKEIYFDIVLIYFTEIPDERKHEIHARCQKYGFDFGDHQFNDYTFLILNLEKEHQIKFIIYEMDGKSEPKVHSYQLEGGYFISVYKEFMRYAWHGDLKKHKPFFPEGFSYDDIK